ncbi:MAG: hypothetical protein HUJ68_02740 [Clostridia bacterium]|nr:hypothetical protein [Clostridia bacterium]
MKSEIIFNKILEAKGFDNDDRYSRSNIKLSIEEIHNLFLDTEKLVRFYYDRPELLSVSSCDYLKDAVDADSTLGYEEGFYPYACSHFDAATDAIFNLTNLVDENEEITLYRGVELVGDAEPDIEHPGVCWTFDRKIAEEFVSQFDNDDDPNSAPCILTGKTKIKNVDWILSCLLIADMPEEGELRLLDDSQIKIIDTEVL